MKQTAKILLVDDEPLACPRLGGVGGPLAVLQHEEQMRVRLDDLLRNGHVARKWK